jgi:hypothetical protein
MGGAGELVFSAGNESPRVADAGGLGSTVVVAKRRLFLPGCTCFQQDFILASDGLCSL